MTKYVVLQEFTSADLLMTWDDIGVYEGSTPKAAVTAAVEAMSEADKTKAKTTAFRVAAASSFVDFPAPSIDTKTTVRFG